VTVRKNKDAKQQHLPKTLLDVVSRNKQEFTSRISKTSLPKMAVTYQEIPTKAEPATGQLEEMMSKPTRNAILRDLDAYEKARNSDDLNGIMDVVASISPVIDEELQRHQVDSIDIIEVVGPAWYNIGVQWERYLDKDGSLTEFLMACSSEIDGDQFRALIMVLAPNILNIPSGSLQHEQPDSIPQEQAVSSKKSSSLNLSEQDLKEFQDRLAPFHRAIDQLNRKLESGLLDANAYDRALARYQQEIEKIRQEFEKRSKHD